MFESIGEIFGESNYVAPFVVLLLCGVGLPIPEEVTLIGSGILVYSGDVEFTKIALVCSVAILLGDSIPFWLGRRYGLRALRVRWVARVLHPERFSRLEGHFRDHGNLATFACRFLAGIRVPGYFLAGTMGMSYARFLILDACGVLLTVPLSIYLGKLFGGEVDRLRGTVKDLHLILAFAALALALVVILRTRWRRPGNRAS